MNFVRIGEIDTMGEKYSAEVQIESKWSDFNPQIVEYRPKEHWNPELYIQNILTELKVNLTIFNNLYNLETN
jgi:hypothetical protein